MSEPIYCQANGNVLRFGNEALELRFSLASGAWLGLTDRTTEVEVVRNPEGAPNIVIVSGGRELVTAEIRNPADPPLAEETYHPVTRCEGYERVRGPDGDTLVFSLRAGPWLVRAAWLLRPGSDIVRLSLAAVWQGQASEKLRYILFRTPLVFAGPASQVVYEAPGQRIAPHRPLAELAADFSMSLGSTPADSPGLAALWNRKTGQVVLSWTFSDAVPTLATVYRDADGIRLEHRLLLADELGHGESVSDGGFYFQANAGGWDAALHRFHQWYAQAGLTVPADRPTWTENAGLYEIHIGNAVVAEGPYEPLPTADALLERLPYIKSLGFNTVQIMPRQPFAGYTVHDYYDVTTQHGDEATLRDVVRTAHSLGLRVIFDLVIHGCIDRLVARQTYERSGGAYPEWLLLWAEIASERSAYLDAHPEWFLRDESGGIRSTYTWAFDHLNESFQRYLIEVMRYYLLDLDADGFRVDAPTWNFFPNWRPDLPYRACDSYNGWACLFRRARPILKAAKADSVLYGEGTGPLYSQSFDVRYDYDGQWLFGAMLELKEERAADWHPSVEDRHITAREAAEWLHQRRLAYPPGTVMAHHIDSHDSFWPHALFRRQVFGLDAWRPCFALCALSDGCIMHYIGGEQGNEEFVRRIMHLRYALPELAVGSCDYVSIQCNDDMVMPLLRSLGRCHAIPVLSFSHSPAHVKLQLPVSRLELAREAYTVHDVLNNVLLKSPDGFLWGRSALEKLEFELPPFGVAVLLLRPARGVVLDA